MLQSLSDLEKKISQSRKELGRLKRKVHFGEYSEWDCEACAKKTSNQNVINILACHSSDNVRKAVAKNQFATYQTILSLLKDKSVSVVRDVLSFGKLEQEDYVLLLERFQEKKSSFALLDEGNYLRLIKLSQRRASWPSSQSICILHNRYIGVDVLKAIDIESFAPFQGNGLLLLLELRDRKVREIEDGIPYEQREFPPEETLPSHLYLSRQHRDRGETHGDSGKADERWRQVEEFFDREYGEMPAEAGVAKKNNVTRGFERDKKLASGKSTTSEQLRELLKSPDDRIVKAALKNPNVKAADLKTFFLDYPDIVYRNDEFRKLLKRSPGLVKKLTLADRIKIIKNYSDCLPIFPDSVISEYLAHLKKSRAGGISKTLNSWYLKLICAASHPSTSKSSLDELYAVIFSDSPEISDKRRSIINAVRANRKFSDC